MKVRIEDLRVGSVQTIFAYDNPMWVKLEFANFTLRIGEERGIAVISSTDASLAIHPGADNQIEIVRRKTEEAIEAWNQRSTDLLKACEIALDALGCDRTRIDRLEAQKIIHAAVKEAKRS